MEHKLDHKVLCPKNQKMQDLKVPCHKCLIKVEVNLEEDQY